MLGNHRPFCLHATAICSLCLNAPCLISTSHQRFPCECQRYPVKWARCQWTWRHPALDEMSTQAHEHVAPLPSVDSQLWRHPPPQQIGHCWADTGLVQAPQAQSEVCTGGCFVDMPDSRWFWLLMESAPTLCPRLKAKLQGMDMGPVPSSQFLHRHVDHSSNVRAVMNAWHPYFHAGTIFLACDRLCMTRAMCMPGAGRSSSTSLQRVTSCPLQPAHDSQ